MRIASFFRPPARNYHIGLLFFTILFPFSGYGQSSEIATEDLVNYKLNGNLVNNGSFELGIGAGPIYPSWQEDDTDLYTIDDRLLPLPVIDETTGAAGSRSLRFNGLLHNQAAGFKVRPPNIDYTGEYDLYYSINAKSNGPGVFIYINGRNLGEATTDWQQFTYKSHFTYNQDSPQIPSFQMKCVNTSEQKRSVWLDSVTWRQSNEDYNWVQSSPVEAVFIPERRDSMHFVGDDVKLKIRLTSDVPRSVRLELHIRDLSATSMQTQPLPESVTVPYIEENVSVDTDIFEKEVNLGAMPPGAYMAIIGIKDESTGELIGAEHELFTVLFNNLNTPPLKGFVVGFQDSIMAFDANKIRFEWRGEWTPDEYWQNHNIVGTRMHRIMFAVRDNYTDENNIFVYRDLNLKTAARNNCRISFSYSRVAQRMHELDSNFNNTNLMPSRWRRKVGRYVSHGKSNQSSSPSIVLPTRYQYKRIAIAQANTINVNNSVENIEVDNEQNILYKTEYSLEGLIEPKYTITHLHAPDKKVYINYWAEWRSVYSDFSIYKYLDFEGGKFIDGITYHPYGAAQINSKFNGLWFSESIRKIQDKFSTESKRIPFGSTEEIVGQGIPGEPGWKVIQEFMLEWMSGAYFSCAPRGAGFYFMETQSQNSWGNKLGPRAPGMEAVAISAMNHLLSGYEFVKSISLNDNYDLLIACFKNDNGKYAAVIAGSDKETQVAELNVDFSGIGVTEYDIWGRASSSIASPLIASRWPKYYMSDSPDLFDKLEAATHTWVTSDINYKYFSDIRKFRMQNEEPPEWSYLYLLRALPPRD